MSSCLHSHTHTHTHSGRALRSKALISPQETYESTEHLYIIHKVHSSYAFLKHGRGTTTALYSCDFCDFSDLTSFCMPLMSVVQLSVQEFTADTDPGPGGQAAAKCFIPLTELLSSLTWLSAGGPRSFVTISQNPIKREIILFLLQLKLLYLQKNHIYMDLLLRAGRCKSSQSTQTHSLNVSPCNCPPTFSSFHLSSSSALGERARE